MPMAALSMKDQIPMNTPSRRRPVSSSSESITSAEIEAPSVIVQPFAAPTMAASTIQSCQVPSW
jgi:hypothetical protein